MFPEKKAIVQFYSSYATQFTNWFIPEEATTQTNSPRKTLSSTSNGVLHYPRKKTSQLRTFEPRPKRWELTKDASIVFILCSWNRPACGSIFWSFLYDLPRSATISSLSAFPRHVYTYSYSTLDILDTLIYTYNMYTHTWRSIHKLHNSREASRFER